MSVHLLSTVLLRKYSMVGLLATAIAMNDCKGWRQTARCKGNGPREPARDAACTTLIANDRSGFCECTRPSGAERLSFDCGHVPFTCKSKCAKSAGRSSAANGRPSKMSPKWPLRRKSTKPRTEVQKEHAPKYLARSCGWCAAYSARCSRAATRRTAPCYNALVSYALLGGNAMSPP